MSMAFYILICYYRLKDMIWYDMIFYDMIFYDMIIYDMMWYMIYDVWPMIYGYMIFDRFFKTAWYSMIYFLNLLMQNDIL